MSLSHRDMESSPAPSRRASVSAVGMEDREDDEVEVEVELEEDDDDDFANVGSEDELLQDEDQEDHEAEYHTSRASATTTTTPALAAISGSAATAASSTAAIAASSSSSAIASIASPSSSSTSAASVPVPTPMPAPVPAKSLGDKTYKIAIKRLTSDFKQMENDPPEGVSGAPLDLAAPFVWRCAVFGPSDTTWEGGVFQLQMQFGVEYPQKPPNVRFISKMYHPNVFADGNLCLDIIQDKWSPVYSVSSILTSIQSLLADPNAASPANPDAARLFASKSETDQKEYRRRVRACVEKSTEG